LAIENLQQQNVPLMDSIKIIQNIQKSFEMLSDANGKAVQKKLNQILKKNHVLSAILKISKILTGEETSNHLDRFPEERSFSTYKTLLSNNKRSFKFENIRKHLTIQCNSQGK